MVICAMDGFETGIATLPDHSAGTGSVVAMTGADGSGIALRTNQITSGLFGKTIAPGSDTIYFHAHRRLSSAVFGQTGNASLLFLVQAGGINHLSVNFDATGHMTARLGTGAATILATSTLTLSSTAAWYSVEAKVLIADSAGEITVKIDGVTWISFFGDTRNAGSSTRPDRLLFGAGNSADDGVDDFILNDTTGSVNNSWTGEISIVGVRPAGNGSSSNLVGSDGNSVNNYQQVDESPLNTSDYNGGATTGQIDTYDMTAVGKLGTVLAVQLATYAAKSDAGAKTFKHVARSATPTTMKSSAQALSTSYTVYTSPIWLTDADNNPWTVARVDAHEFGFEVQ